MVNQINVHFNPKEFKDLLKKKKDLSWHDYILELLEIKKGFKKK